MTAAHVIGPTMTNESRWKKRRVFVVTALSPDEIRQKLRDSGVLDEFEQEFTLTREDDEAEFIVFDLSHLPKWFYAKVGRERWVERWPAIDATHPVPFFFATLVPPSNPAAIPQRTKDHERIKEAMDAVGIDMRVHDAKTLVEDLRWFRCMLPFYKSRGPQATSAEAARLAAYEGRTSRGD